MVTDEFQIVSHFSRTITGTFYGSPLRNGKLNLDRGALRFAFVTQCHFKLNTL